MQDILGNISRNRYKTCFKQVLFRRYSHWGYLLYLLPLIENGVIRPYRISAIGSG